MQSNFLSSIIPNFNNNSSQAGDIISNLLNGTPNPATSQNAAATFGVQNGQGAGSGIGAHYGYDLYGQQGAQRQQTGIQDLLSMISGISNPTLQNQGQQFQNNQFGQNLNERQTEFNTDQNNNTRDFNENQRRYNDANQPKRPFYLDFTDPYGKHYGDSENTLIPQQSR